MRTSKLARITIYGLLAVFGAITAWHAAPDIEAYLFPIYTEEYLLPFDLARPGVYAERQLDRICWRPHIRKVRAAVAVRRSIAIVAGDGQRYFTAPLDGRTGAFFSSKDAAPKGYEGNYAICAYLPNEFDATQAFTIESFGQYEVPHHLYLLDHIFPTVHVPAATEGDGQ